MVSQPTTDSPGLPQPSLLFVDDEPTILTALRVIFRKGYRVVATTDGEEALQILATQRIDVIVCDQRMPRITGVELLARARSISPTSVRVLLTGYADNEAVMGAINEGEVHRFLQKPWDNHVLRQMVDDAVALSERLRRADGTRAAFARSGPAAATGETSARPMRDGAASSPATAQIVRFPQSPRPRETHVDVDLDSLPAVDVAPGEREHVLVIDRRDTLYRELSSTGSAEFHVAHAPDIPGGMETMTRLPVRVIVFALHTDSEFERGFLKLLKSEHPGIIVIAVCDAADSSHMIELINHARIFRFLRQPVSAPLLARHVRSASMLARRLHEIPELTAEHEVRAADAMPSTPSGTPDTDLRPYFSRLNDAIRSRLARWLVGPPAS